MYFVPNDSACNEVLNQKHVICAKHWFSKKNQLTGI